MFKASPEASPTSWWKCRDKIRLATRWAARGSNPGGGARFSAPIQTGPGTLKASCTTGTGSFPEVKRLGPGIDHPPISSAEVKERVELQAKSAAPLGLRGLF